MKGIYSALICPFDKDGRVKVNGLHQIIEHNINVCGVDGLYVNGSTGESFNMPFEDRKLVLRETASCVNKRIHLIAQIGCNVTDEIYELADLCALLGYDAVSAVAPFYFPYSKKELIDHYKALADRSSLPLIIYNIPIRTGVSLTRDDFKELLSYSNIAGVKFTCNDFFLLEQVRSDFPDKLIVSGFDEMLYSAAVLHTDGAIGSTYNIIGFWAKQLFDAVHRNDNAAALALQHKINIVVEKLLKPGLMPTIKAVLAEYSIDSGECRLPMGRINDEQRSAAKDVFRYVEENR